MRRGPTMTLSFPPFTPAVKQLLIANGAIFLAVAVVGAFTTFGAESWVDFHFGLVPQLAVLHGWIWQLVTYSFIHAASFTSFLTCWRFGCSARNSKWTGATASSCSFTFSA